MSGGPLPCCVRMIAGYSSESIIRDTNKCILCADHRSVKTSKVYRFVSRLPGSNQGGPPNGLGQCGCTNCGQCVAVCPVGALKERSAIDDVWKALNDKAKHVVVQVARRSGRLWEELACGKDPGHREDGGRPPTVGF